MSLEALILDRITETRERIARLRAAIAREEVTCKRWEDALALELQLKGRPTLDVEDVLPQNLPRTFTLAEAKNKEAMLRAVLEETKTGLTSSQIVQAVHPAIARSSVFALIKRMKAAGTIVQNERGFITLTDKHQQQTPP